MKGDSKPPDTRRTQTTRTVEPAGRRLWPDHGLETDLTDAELKAVLDAYLRR